MAFATAIGFPTDCQKVLRLFGVRLGQSGFSVYPASHDGVCILPSGVIAACSPPCSDLIVFMGLLEA